MTEIILQEGKDLWKIEAKGHATGAPEVCAAISNLMTAVAGWAMCRNDVTVHESRLSSGEAVISFAGDRTACRAIWELAQVDALLLQQAYPQTVRAAILEA